MDKTFAKQYIRANAPGIAIGAIRARLWRDKPIKESVERNYEYERTAGYCNPEEMRGTILNYLREAATCAEGLYKLLDIDRERLVSPCYRTMREYIRGECGLETELTGEQISAIIACELA